MKWRGVGVAVELAVAVAVAVAVAFVSGSALAAAFDPAGVIANRSGLPASEVDAALAHCDDNQMYMNLCAWRDQIVAEHKLEQVVDKKAGSSATCRAVLDKKVAAWKNRRDANCEKSASREWGGGSMLPTAVAMCKTGETERMSNAIGSMKCR
jgi:uncharacterized protein YecT (DUF1311 family)